MPLKSKLLGSKTKILSLTFFMQIHNMPLEKAKIIWGLGVLDPSLIIKFQVSFTHLHTHTHTYLTEVFIQNPNTPLLPLFKSYPDTARVSQSQLESAGVIYSQPELAIVSQSQPESARVIESKPELKLLTFHSWLLTIDS